MDPVWTAVVAFAGGSLMSTLVAAFATHLIFHPVISVCLNSKKGCHGPTTLLGRDAAGNEVRSEVKYFRLYVENTGLSSIKSCSGYITELRKRVGGQEIRAPRDIIELGWAHKSDAPRDIPRGAFFYIDVATLYGTVLSLSHKFPTTLLNFFDDKGRYEFEILIAAENARPVRNIQVKFDYDPSRDELQFTDVDRERMPWWAGGRMGARVRSWWNEE
jgi:hypothetical protein